MKVLLCLGSPCLLGTSVSNAESLVLSKESVFLKVGIKSEINHFHANSVKAGFCKRGNRAMQQFYAQAEPLHY